MVMAKRQFLCKQSRLSAWVYQRVYRRGQALCVVCCFVCCFPAPACGLPGADSRWFVAPGLLSALVYPLASGSLPAVRVAPARFPTTGQGHALATQRSCAEASACFVLRFRGGKLPRHLFVFCRLCVFWITALLLVVRLESLPMHPRAT
jgi:hypothetical protein